VGRLVEQKGGAIDPYVWWILLVRDRGLERQLGGDDGRLLIDGISTSAGSPRRLQPSVCQLPRLYTHGLLSANLAV
jgi:hypothetical protein